jgi:hypothetical protein
MHGSQSAVKDSSPICGRRSSSFVGQLVPTRILDHRVVQTRCGSAAGTASIPSVPSGRHGCYAYSVKSCQCHRLGQDMHTYQPRIVRTWIARIWPCDGGTGVSEEGKESIMALSD